jgi:hypothetical protein
LTIAVAVTGILVGFAASSWAGEDNSVGLAKTLAEASVSLDQALKASESKGKPISGRYEIADGALQLSVYTMKGDDFNEVIVDHKSGAIKKAEKIPDAGDLKDAKEQSQAMANAKGSLGKAVADFVFAAGAATSLRDHHMTAHLGASYAAVGFLCFAPALGAEHVVVYCSMKEDVGRSVAERFEKETNTSVKLVPGKGRATSKELVARLIAEKNRSGADVFWCCDPAGAMILKSKGLSAPYESPNAKKCARPVSRS